VSQESTTPDLVELVRYAIDASNREDYDAIARLFAPDLVWTSLDGLGTFEGVPGFKAFSKRLSAPTSGSRLSRRKSSTWAAGSFRCDPSHRPFRSGRCRGAIRVGDRPLGHRGRSALPARQAVGVPLASSAPPRHRKTKATTHETAGLRLVVALGACSLTRPPGAAFATHLPLGGTQVPRMALRSGIRLP
jgi:hypothetical protein